MKPLNSKYFLILVLFFFCGCEEAYYHPKPKSYFRIDFREKSYEPADIKLPFRFEIPNYSRIETTDSGNKFNLAIPEHKARIYFSYFPLDEKNFQPLLEEAYNYAYTHNQKASAINTKSIYFEEKNVSGLIYDLKGNVASPIQFFITDSTNHFLRGGLYFLHKPQADSIAPVIEYVKEDIQHIYKTINWD